MVAVAPAESHQVDALAALLEEMDRHYGATELEPPKQRVAHIREALFGEVPAAFVLLAWDGGQLVGLASYSLLWPAAGVTRSLYLKELYVARAELGATPGREAPGGAPALAGSHSVGWGVRVP